MHRRGSVSRRSPRSSIRSRMKRQPRPAFSGDWRRAAGTPPRSLCGSWLPADYRSPLAIIGLGGEISWPRPTRAGDVLRVESEVVEILPSRSKPNQGIVKVRSTTMNQDGEPVQVFTGKIMAYKRVAV